MVVVVIIVMIIILTTPSCLQQHRRPADSTDEEEDMANCLILLAQGQSPEIPNKQIDENIESYKFNSRRYVEAAATETGKAGFYVYECKTCNRTFPSFQALGGHRASHKKLKAMAEEKKQQQLALSDEEEGQFKKNMASFSLQLGNRGSHSSNNKANKVHECSICGAEFTSGQALGGHMRRHRGPMITNTSLSLSPIALEQEEPKKARNVLSLDLNLPAPEDDHRESKFTFAAKQQQQQQQQQQPQQSAPLLFSAATLVDCHY
ncbi:hypothetical protein L1049_011767 [Liquidambar formosana]|uniref:C2H2-type domain-containing protein n=1 Tax=Liquidambar formosana TaxID=63359 RepID=A0AAP0RRZ8_LIQFO